METIHNRLRAWRWTKARELNVPAYFVLTNASMAAVAAACPTSLDDLARCPGLGPKKLAQFGVSLLELVGLALAEGLEPGIAPPVPEAEETADHELSDQEVSEIAAALRKETASRIARRLRGRFSAAQVEEALRRLWLSA